MKGTLKFLDQTKSSNFINFLQTKTNEINHVKQDYHHPRMFYLTGDMSKAKSFAPKDYHTSKADLHSAATLRKAQNFK